MSGEMGVLKQNYLFCCWELLGGNERGSEKKKKSRNICNLQNVV